MIGHFPAQTMLPVLLVLWGLTSLLLIPTGIRLDVHRDRVRVRRFIVVREMLFEDIDEVLFSDPMGGGVPTVRLTSLSGARPLQLSWFSFTPIFILIYTIKTHAPRVQLNQAADAFLSGLTGTGEWFSGASNELE